MRSSTAASCRDNRLFEGRHGPRGDALLDVRGPDGRRQQGDSRDLPPPGGALDGLTRTLARSGDRRGAASARRRLFCFPGRPRRNIDHHGGALVAGRSGGPPGTGFDSPRPSEHDAPKCLNGLGGACPNSTLTTQEIASTGPGRATPARPFFGSHRGSPSWDGPGPTPGAYGHGRFDSCPADCCGRGGIRKTHRLHEPADNSVHESSILSARNLAGARRTAGHSTLFERATLPHRRLEPAERRRTSSGTPREGAGLPPPPTQRPCAAPLPRVPRQVDCWTPALCLPINWRVSSAGRAPDRRSGGHGFESRTRRSGCGRP